jgi:CHAD domain-containing protein
MEELRAGGDPSQDVPSPDALPPAPDEDLGDPVAPPSATGLTPSTATPFAAPVRELPPIPKLGSRPDPIDLGDSFAIAGRKAMWVHLDRLLTREATLDDPERPDELRKYRVAVRRLRAALRMFRDAYPGRETRPLRRGLADLADSVGAVRDVDHRIADLNRWALERGDDARAAVAPLLDAWGSERERAVRQLLARIRTRRHRRFLGDLVTFVEARPVEVPGGDVGEPDALGDRLASTIWTAYEEVRAYAPVVRWADVEALHQLRVEAKRLRDDLEFLADVLGDDRGWLTERLVALQDHLGTMNDALIAAGAVRTFLQARHHRLTPEQNAEIVAYLADREREVARLKRTSLRPWRPVAGITFARRLGRIVVVPALRASGPTRSVRSRTAGPTGTGVATAPATRATEASSTT